MSMEFSRQGYRSGLPFPPPGDLPDLGIEPTALAASWTGRRILYHCATRETHEYWSGWPIPSPGALPNPGIKPGSPALQEDSLSADVPGKPVILLGPKTEQIMQFTATWMDLETE